MPTPQFPAALTRRQILQGAAAFSASTLFSGCASALAPPSAATPLLQPATNPQPMPTGSITAASLTVSNIATGTIGPAFAGLSYEKSALTEPLFTPSNANLIGLFQQLGPSLLRIGGNSVDQTVWTPNGRGQTPGQIAPADVAALAAFVKQAGWQCLYAINLGGAATGATTPALAAAEVAYAAQQFGPALLGIEIGNECDGYGASYFSDNWSLAQFETLWQQFRAAILAQTPGVALTGPASAGNESTWTVPFGQSVTRNQISLLTQHYYRGNGQSATATATNLVSPDTNLPRYLSTLNAGAQSIGIPYRMAECNSYFNGGTPNVSNAYASALWVVDFLFNCAQGGAAGVNLHGGGNYTGYTPIADNSGPVIGPRPGYYGMKLFTLAGQGTLYQTQLSTSGLNANAYAVKTPDGGLNLIVVNKDTTQSLELTALLPQTASIATLIAMTGPSLTATDGITIQSSTIAPSGSFTPSTPYNLTAAGSQIACYVPALSAALIQIT